MRKLPIIAISALVIAFLSLCFYSFNQNQAYDQWIASLDRSKYIEKDERNGNIGDNFEVAKDAKVMIIEYADYQCPGCATTFPFLSDVVKEYKGKVGLIFRSFILSYHKNGTAAAYAANAAALQGYWQPFATLLFKNQSEWEDLSSDKRDAKFKTYFEEATAKKGNTEQFFKDMNDEAVKKKVKADMAVARLVKISETPTIFVNGQKLSTNSVNEADFKKNLKNLIDEELKRNESK
jgi:Na+/H+ antiporter, nhaA family protein